MIDIKDLLKVILLIYIIKNSLDLLVYIADRSKK